MRSFYSPGKYYQGEEILKEIPALIGDFGKNIAIVTDEIVYDIVSDPLNNALDNAEGFGYEYIIFGGESTDPEASRIANIILEKNLEVIVGVGGGKVIDTCKLVNNLIDKTLVVIPTVASSDAPCSHMSVVYDEKGTFLRSDPMLKNPDIVIVDTKVIAGAPLRTFRAGVGDAIATFYEARACKLSGAKNYTKGRASYTGYMIAKTCSEVLYEYGAQAIRDAKQGKLSQAFENVVEANIYLSGVGFENNGCAVAHGTYNGLTFIEPDVPSMHGEIVGYGTLLQLYIEGDEEEFEKAYKFFLDTGMKKSLKELGFKNLSAEGINILASNVIDNGKHWRNMPMEVTLKDIYYGMKYLERRSENV